VLPRLEIDDVDDRRIKFKGKCHRGRAGGHLNALRIPALGVRASHEPLILPLEIVQHKIVPRKVNSNLITQHVNASVRRRIDPKVNFSSDNTRCISLRDVMITRLVIGARADLPEALPTSIDSLTLTSSETNLCDSSIVSNLRSGTLKCSFAGHSDRKTIVQR
jgi:hypothetical protein